MYTPIIVVIIKCFNQYEMYRDHSLYFKENPLLEKRKERERDRESGFMAGWQMWVAGVEV